MSDAATMQVSDTATTGPKAWRMPDTLVLIFIIGLLATALTYIIPAGSFDTQSISYVAEVVERSRTVLDPDSFAYATNEAGELVYNTVGLFESGGGIGGQWPSPLLLHL